MFGGPLITNISVIAINLKVNVTKNYLIMKLVTKHDSPSLVCIA